jgi:hypothetical protein
MPAASSGASSPLSVGATAGWRMGTRRAEGAGIHYSRRVGRDRSGAFAGRAATVAAGVNPSEQRPSVNAAASHGEDGAVAQPLGHPDVRRRQPVVRRRDRRIAKAAKDAIVPPKKPKA